MTSLLTPGLAGESLPSGEEVLRLLKYTTPEGVVSPTDFDLSSDDKLSLLKSISVYAVRLTTIEQAVSLMQDASKCKHWCKLQIDEIRMLRPEPDEKKVLDLDVVWDPKMVEEGNRVPDVRPGASGHSGITGLMREPELPRPLYKSLRNHLARLASKSMHPIKS